MENSYKEMEVPTDHVIYIMRNLCVDQEVTIRMEHETMDWFKIGHINVSHAHLRALTPSQTVGVRRLGELKLHKNKCSPAKYISTGSFN